ncbi:MAG: glucose-6-phosphate isomerase [Chromatocurvus sp.]
MTLFDSPETRRLALQSSQLQQQRIETLLATDVGRTRAFSREAAGIHLDFSRHLLDNEALAGLLTLAERANISAHIDALFSGRQVNATEGRPALHMLLRATSAPDEARLAQVMSTRERMRQCVEKLHDGRHTGFAGQPITDVVNIGIGGSDLGPRLVSEALAPLSTPGPRVHYVANIDPEDLRGAIAPLNPASTLFIVCSKSFGTEETLHNALAARRWLQQSGATDDDLARHFLAVTSNLQAAADFGIPADNCLPLWDWVGGRYSLWSAVGLSTAIATGWDAFTALLRGAEDMDRHFRETAAQDNLPVLMSLLEIWCCHFLGAGNHAVLPYAHRLRRLPDFLQQLTMESNGKRVDCSGAPIDGHSAPVLWGAAGTIGQHSFHQLLHQGTRLCPVDLILPLAPTQADEDGRHARLVANCLAQSRALMVGRTEAEAEASLRQRGQDAVAASLAPHLAMPGNRPHSILSLQSLTPHALGALLALYEHRTYCSSVFWNINAFDQWGVELGKVIGTQVHAAMHGEAESDRAGRSQGLDTATQASIQRWRDANS